MFFFLHITSCKGLHRVCHELVVAMESGTETDKLHRFEVCYSVYQFFGCTSHLPRDCDYCFAAYRTTDSLHWVISRRADSRWTIIALTNAKSVPERSFFVSRRTFSSTSRIFQSCGSMAATVNNPRGGSVARFPTNFRACFKLQKVSENLG
jgi:hypothetical protein